MYNNEEQDFYPSTEENFDNHQFYVSVNNEKKEKKKREKNKNSFGRKMTRCVAYAMAFGLVAGTAFEGGSYAVSQIFPDSSVTAAGNVEEASADSSTKLTNVSTSSLTSSSTDVSQVVSEVMPAIVAITNMSEVQYRSMWGQVENYEEESAGSGIVIDEDDTYYYIVTNNHVVSGATTLTVQFYDDSTATAEVQGTDSSTDLAVVKVKKTDMEASALESIRIAAIGDSEELLPGQAAIAIGNALGYGQSVTTGVISALEREVSMTDDTTRQTITNKLIQTDAAINPGNSGGALINMNGEVIGINSVKYSDTTVEGMGFAIPMSTAKPIIEELIENGSASSTTARGAYLGVVGVNVTSDVASQYNLPIGAYITKVMADSAAAAAGLAQGDVITGIDGKEIGTFEELKEVISSHEVGDTVQITYMRRDASGEYSESTASVTLGEYTEESTQSSSQDNGQNSMPDQDNEQNDIPNQGGQNPFPQQ